MGHGAYLVFTTARHHSVPCNLYGPHKYPYSEHWFFKTAVMEAVILRTLIFHRKYLMCSQKECATFGVFQDIAAFLKEKKIFCTSYSNSTTLS